MSARDDVARFWDEQVTRWVGGDAGVQDELGAWFQSYGGAGRGEVVLEAFPEPYLGPMAGPQPAMALLGLNPGRAVLEFQGREGLFTAEVARSSYSRWAAAAPYSSAAWEQRMGRNRYHLSRLRFAQELLQRPNLGPEELLTVELYPWHSTAVTGPMRPPAEVLETFVWAPLRELDVEHVFAFGKPWVHAASGLGLGDGALLDVAWTSSRRHALAYAMPSKQTLIVIHQSGYAGPPSPAETRRLAAALGMTP